MEGKVPLMDLVFGSGSLLAIIVGAYLAKRAGFFGPKDYHVLQTMIFNVTLPAAAVRAFASSEHDLSLMWVTAFGFVAASLPLFAIYAFTRGQSTSSRAFQMFNGATFNIGSFALPTVITLLGPVAGVTVIMFDLGNVVMCAVGSQILTTSLLRLKGNPIEGDTLGQKIHGVARRFYSSLIFDVYLVLFVLLATGGTVPDPILTVIDPLASANTFLSMAMVGMMMEMPSSREDFLDFARVLGWRLGAAIVLALCALFLLPVPADVRMVAAITVFAPIPLFACKFTDDSLGRGKLAGFSLTASAMLSLIIMAALCIVLPAVLG